MRILYDNLLEAAAIIATNADVNYPVGNFSDTTLLTEFRATTNSSVITCTLAEASTVSAFAFGNHNINTLSIKLTDVSLGTTTYGYTAADLKHSDIVTQKMIYETAVTNVTKIEYTITSVASLYIGGLSAGQYIQFPSFDVLPKLPRKSTGSKQKSRGGVTFNVPGVVLESFGCTINAGTITDYNAINAFFAAVQTYKPYYVDRWQGLATFPVLFAQNTKDISWTKGPEGIIFDSFRLELEECK